MNLFCPECGGPVRWHVGCPGHPVWRDKFDDHPHILVCQPPCGGSLLFECIDDVCDWWYADPLHQRRSHPGMGVRPGWYRGFTHFLGLAPTGWELSEEGV